MRIEKWWTPETIFVMALGAVMTVVLSGSLFVRPFVSKTGSALVPPSVLQNVRTQQQECQTITGDDDDLIAVSLKNRC